MTILYAVRGEDGRKLDWHLLAEACRRVWGWEALPAVERSPRGKPFFPGEPDRFFSLSHSGGYALCALSDGRGGGHRTDPPPAGAPRRDRPQSPGEGRLQRRLGGVFPPLDPERELVQAGGRPPVSAPAGGDPAPMPVQKLGRGGLGRLRVLRRRAPGGHSLAGP